MRLDQYSGVRIQKLGFFFDGINIPGIEINDTGILILKTSELAKNDGLSLPDFEEWFEPYDLSKPLAIIHFTNYRY